MATLREVLLSTEQRTAVLADCVRLIDQEVDDKSGLGGLAIKGAYTVVKRIKPGIIHEFADHLLEAFVDRLEPFYASGRAQQAVPLDRYLQSRADDIAQTLLAVTDARAQRARNATLKKTYDKLRPSALRHVVQAVPAISRLVAKYG